MKRANYLTFHAEIKRNPAGYILSDEENVWSSAIVARESADETEASDEGDPGVARQWTYNPFEVEPALFMIFAEILPRDMSYDEIQNSLRRPDSHPGQQLTRSLLDFVNRYGIPRLYESVWGIPSEARVYNLVWSAVEMGLALELHREVQAGDQETVSSLVSRGEDGRTYVSYRGWEFNLTDEPQSLPKRLSEHAMLVRSRGSVGFTMATIEALIDRGAKTQLEFWQPTPDALALRLRAEDLLSAMWLQLAVAIAADKRYRRCECCDKPFELQRRVQGRKGRADKRFCSVNCRIKNHKRQQRRAIKMYQEGEDLPAISEATGVDEETLRRWL